MREVSIAMRRAGHIKSADKLYSIAYRIEEMYGNKPKSLEDIKESIADSQQVM